MIYTRRFWRHASVLATRSFGQGIVVALGGDVFNVWGGDMDARAVLFAGAGMAASSVAMSLGRATVAPRRNEPEDLREINAMIDAHFSDAYGPPPPVDAFPPYDHDSHDPVGHPDGPAMLR